MDYQLRFINLADSREIPAFHKDNKRVPIHYLPTNLPTNQIRRYFHAVLRAILHLYKEVIKLLTLDTLLSPTIANDPKYRPYFKDCLGALDGTYINVHVKLED